MTPQNLEDIHTVVIHCSATGPDDDIGVVEIDHMHRNRKPPFSMVGYHLVIRRDGTVENGREPTRRGAHVKGNNTNTFAICMVGGIGDDGQPVDNFTDEQFMALRGVLENCTFMLPNLTAVVGHRDFSPDLNGDGLITPDEWIKECPCFDVREKLDELGFRLINEEPIDVQEARAKQRLAEEQAQPVDEQLA